MATTQDVTVDTDRDEVQITNLTVHDDELAAYLADKTVDERATWASEAFKIGARTLQLSETSKDLEYVKREFERMRNELQEDLDSTREELNEHLGDDGELKQALEDYLGDKGELREHLDDAFGAEGAFVERLEQELGEDGRQIQEALDPDVEGTPTYRLKSELRDEIKSIKAELDKERGREEVR